ncbi:MAG: glycosyltransferase family 39 protein [Chloroflexi bacterium]|nr:glycosyltransferase family 39 protein [Chloroflexota bacterium]
MKLSLWGRPNGEPIQEGYPTHQWLVGETLLLGILLLALGLRLYRLDGQSLWYDEGTSAGLATRDWVTIARNAADDIHPPLYYFLLRGWAAAVGTSEFGLRSLSVVAGTLTVLATYFLGRALFGRRVALVAAALSALSPFQVYYSQEARMYIWVTLWGVLGLLALWHTLRRWTVNSPDKRSVLTPFFLYLASTTAALYTHYFAISLVVVGNAIFLAWLYSHRERLAGRIAGWAAGQGTVALLYLPWLSIAGGQLQRWPAISEPFSLQFLATESLRVLSLGTTAEASWAPWLWLFGGILGVGLLPQARGRIEEKPGPGLRPRLFALLYVLIPPLVLYAISIQRPAWSPKLLLLASPGFYLLLARGIGGEWLTSSRARSIFSSALFIPVALASLASLQNYYFNPRYALDDYRGLARYIAENGRPGDAVLLNAPTQIEIFSYYYAEGLPLYPLPLQRPLDPIATQTQLGEIAAQHQRLYAILWATQESDPGRFIEGWLDQHAYKALETWFDGVRLVLYGLPGEIPSDRITHLRRILLGEEIEFLGYDLPRTRLTPGEIVPVTLFWRARGPIADRYKVFIHVLDSAERIVAQRDSEPGGGALPTTTWTVGETILDREGVLLPPDTPPGEYRIAVGVYHWISGERLPVQEEGGPLDTRFLLLPIRIE